MKHRPHLFHLRFMKLLAIAMTACTTVASGAVPQSSLQDVPAAGVPAKTLTPPPPKHPAGKKRPPAVSAAKPLDDRADKSEKPQKTAYDFSLPGADGKSMPLSSYKGKYIVVVNLARKSTYNEQLQGLIRLHDTYQAKDVVVIGVPSNDFGAGEPGTAAEVQKAYADAKVNFPVTAVAKVSGDDPLPLFLYLTKSKTAPPGGPVHWNYTKFVIDKKGNVIARLDPDVAPSSAEMLATLDQILGGTFKPKKAGAKPDAGAPDDDEDE